MTYPQANDDIALGGNLRSSTNESTPGPTERTVGAIPGPCHPLGQVTDVSVPQPSWRTNDLHPEDVDALIPAFQRYCHTRGPSDCWLWTGHVNPGGYGVVKGETQSGIRDNLAHRVAWVVASREPLINGMTIDHLCRNTRCVNPSHLEPVPVEENLRRAMAGRFPDSEKKDRAMRPQRATVALEVDPNNYRRRLCPVCRTAYGSSYVGEHIRRVHPEAA